MKLLVCLVAFLGSQAPVFADSTTDELAARIAAERHYLDARWHHMPKTPVTLWRGPSRMLAAIAGAYAYLDAAEEHLEAGYIGHARLALNRAAGQRQTFQRIRTLALQPRLLWHRVSRSARSVRRLGPVRAH